MSQTLSMSADPEGVQDSPSHSVPAVLAALAGLVGLLSTIAPSFWVVAAIGGVLGLGVLLVSHRWGLSTMARSLAAFGVYAGLFGCVAGGVLIFRKERLLEKQAVEVAVRYVEALAKGDRGEAIRLTGLPPAVEDPTVPEGQMSREQRAVRKFLDDPTIKSVIERGQQAKWRATEVKSKYRTGNTIEMEVGFFDETLANARPYVVILKMTLPQKYAADQRREWYVDRLSIDRQQ